MKNLSIYYMQIIITESQFKCLSEQSMVGWAKDLPSSVATEVNKSSSKGDHTVNSILQIGTSFIPIVGPFLSAGIGLMDAAQYYQEGDTKTAGLMAMFSILPGIGPIVNKIPGIKQLGTKGLSVLASKLGKGITKLTPLEQEVVTSLNVNNQLVKNELNNQVKQMAVKSLTTKVGSTSKILNSVAKSGLFISKSITPYVAANSTYNKVYDSFNPQKQFVDFNNIDVNKINKINKEAALNVKF